MRWMILITKRGYLLSKKIPSTMLWSNHKLPNPMRIPAAKPLSKAASIPAPVKVPVTDWTKYPLYSHTLTSWRYQYLADQMNFYLITIASTVCIGKAFWRSWNIKKAMEILKTKEDFVEIGKFYFHMHVNCENWKGICYFWTIICSFWLICPTQKS